MNKRLFFQRFFIGLGILICLFSFMQGVNSKVNLNRFLIILLIGMLSILVGIILIKPEDEEEVLQPELQPVIVNYKY